MKLFCRCFQYHWHRFSCCTSTYGSQRCDHSRRWHPS